MTRNRTNDLYTDTRTRYEYFFDTWHGTKYESYQREFLFTYVHHLRNVGTWGNYQHWFEDRYGKMIGPQDTETACYAMWLLYMETFNE